jgi:hypothetical protein
MTKKAREHKFNAETLIINKQISSGCLLDFTTSVAHRVPLVHGMALSIVYCFN